jgi:hypothetical protein
MPLVRATLATAVSTVQGLVADMRKAARETGSAAGLDHLLAGLDGLDAYCGKKLLEIEVALSGPLSGEEADKVAAAIASGFPVDKLRRGLSEPTVVDMPGPPVDVRVHLRPITHRTVLRAGAPRPPVFMVVIPRPVPISEDDIAALERGFDDRPQAILVGQPEEQYFKEVEGKARSGAWGVIKVDLAQPLEQINAAQGRFAPGTPFEPFPDLYRAHSACSALDSLAGVLTMVAEQQAKELKLNKSTTTQKLSKFGGTGPGAAKPASPAADIVAEIKGRTQRLASEFERGASERLLELLNQPTGSLAREVDNLIEELDHLDQEQRVTTIGSRVPPEFIDQINRTIRERFFRHAMADVTAMNDLFRMIGQDVDRTLAAAGGYPITAQFRYLTDERVRRTLDMYGTFQVNYKGESAAKGFSEYLSSVRKYSMLLVMAASMFGMSSLVRQYREITVPVTIILVGWGTYSVYTGTKRQRIEVLEKQLDDARIQMRNEIKRIMAELQKAWDGFLKAYLKEQIDGTMAELEAGIKDYQARRGGAQDPEKDRLQRQMQALEAAEKKLTASAKNRETLVQSVQQTRGDLKGLTAGGPPKPGMPGAAPGMARPGMPAMPGAPGGAPRPPAAPAGPSMQDAKAAAMAEAKAKLEALKAPKPAAGAAAAPTDAAKAPSPMDAIKEKMAAAKAAAAAPAAGAPADAAKPPSPMDAIKAKMAAAKAAAAGGAAAAPAPAAAAAPADAAKTPAPAAESVAAAAAAAPAAAEAPAPAEAAPAAPAVAAAPAGDAKPSALEAYKAKMAAMKAGGAKPADAPKADEPAAAPAGGNGPVAAAPAAAAAKPSAMEAYKAKMAAMKAAGATPAAAAAAPVAAAEAAPAATPAEKAPAEADAGAEAAAPDETQAIPPAEIAEAKASE